MNKDLLSPNDLELVLQNRIDELSYALTTLNRRIPISIPGRLRIIKNKMYPQYYHVTSNDAPDGQYIPKRNLKTAEQLAQKEYLSTVKKHIQYQIEILSKTLEKLKKSNIEKDYSSLSCYRQKLITPVIQTDEQFISSWKSQKVTAINSYPNETDFYTKNKIHVRSKSELIIANTLEANDIPYFYEYPVKIKNKTYFPDFYCLNIHTRKAFFWEHMGQMSIEDYAQKNIQKLITYQEAKIIPGQNLILSFEMLEAPINTKYIQSLINAYLL